MHVGSRHPLPGEWLAYARLNGPIVAGLAEHLPTCEECTRLYEILKTDNDANALSNSYVFDNECPQNIEDIAAVLLMLLRSDLDGEARLVLLRHFNQCGDCFEFLSTNWNAYLNVKKQGAAAGQEVGD